MGAQRSSLDYFPGLKVQRRVDPFPVVRVSWLLVGVVPGGEVRALWGARDEKPERSAAAGGRRAVAQRRRVEWPSEAGLKWVLGAVVR